MTGTGPDDRRQRVSRVAGDLTLVLGLLAAAATAYAYRLSLSEDFNPPNWVRVVGLVWLPIGVFGAPVAYLFARTGPGRRRGDLGLAVTGMAIVAFIALLSLAG